MFDEKYLIPRAKLTHPAWVLYKDEADAIGKTGVGQKKDYNKPYKPWSDPTHTNINSYSIFVGEENQDPFVKYWTLGPGLLAIDDERVKHFYRENDAWQAYQAMVESRFVFTKGVPWAYEIYVPRKDALEANFGNADENGVYYGYPLKLNVANEAVILLPPYVSGKTEVAGIPYQKFIQGLPKVVKEDKIKVIVGICNNASFTYEDKVMAIIKVLQSPDSIPDPTLTGEGLKRVAITDASTEQGPEVQQEAFYKEAAKKYEASLASTSSFLKENAFVGGFLNKNG